MLQKFLIKSVVVTGANRGIGLELVKYFVEQNKQYEGHSQPVKVISCSRCSSPELDDLLDHISHIELEVTDAKSVSMAAKKVSDIVGPDGLNLLINNAAITYHENGVIGCSDQEMRETLDVNVLGPHSVTNKFYPLLKQAAECNSHIPLCCARAAVLNISSELGSILNTNNSFTTAYRVSKAALNMLTKCQASEFIKDGIISMSVHPGWVRTDLGGPRAPLSTQESVEDIAHMIAHCTEDHNGMYVRKNLVSVPY